MTAVRLTPSVMAADQTVAAMAEVDRDTSKAPRWFTPKLDEEYGRLLPGDLIVVGATAKAGKTRFMLSELEALAVAGRRVLFFPLEMRPKEARLQWAACRLGFPWDLVASGRWDELPRGSRDEMKKTLVQLRQLEHVQFPDDNQATVGQVKGWVEWAVKDFKAEVVMVDHFHRLDVGGGQNYRVNATEAVRQLKNIALASNVVMLMSAQFNRSTDPMDLLKVPGVSRFKETGALVEESSVALVLSRQMRAGVDKAEMRAVRDGLQEPLTLAEPDVMRVGCVAHRRRDMGQVRPVRLVVTDTFVRDRFAPLPPVGPQ